MARDAREPERSSPEPSPGDWDHGPSTLQMGMHTYHVYTMCPRSVHSDKQAVLALYSVENVGEKARLPISVALL